MTTPNSGEFAAAANEPLDFDAFLQDAALDDIRLERNREALQKAQEDIARAVYHNGIDISEGSVTESIDDPERAKNFRQHVFETICTFYAVEKQATEAGDEKTLHELRIQKKQLIAGYIVTGCLTQDDKWYRLIDTLLPGDAPDEHNVDDSIYFIEAMDQYQRELDLHPAIQEIYTRIAILVREHLALSDLDSFDEEKYENLVHEITQIVEYLADDLPMQEAHLDDLARREGFSSDSALQFKQLAGELSRLTVVE